MAIAATYFTTATCTTAPTAFYTVSSTAYNRDLVITSAGSGTIFVSLDASTSATSAAGFKLPAGGSVVLTQCQVPQGAIVGATASSTASTSTYMVALGWGSVVSVV